MKRLIVFLILLLTATTVSSRYVAPYDSRDLNTLEYYPQGVGPTPTGYTVQASPSQLNFINWVTPSYKNIDLISDGNIEITPDFVNSTIKIGFSPDVNLNGSTSSISDTNANTECDGNTVLTGDGTCLGVTGFHIQGSASGSDTNFATFPDFNNWYASLFSPNFLGDANFVNLEADYFYGDGSGLTGVTGATDWADLNNHLVPYIDATKDVNLGAYAIKAFGDSNFGNAGFTEAIYANSYFGTGDLNIYYPSSGHYCFYDASNGSFACGGEEISATGAKSVAFGQWSNATGSYSGALYGFDSLASGDYSLAGGNASQATQNYAIALGNSAIASGDTAVAIGSAVRALANNSVAIGSNIKNDHIGMVALATDANVKRNLWVGGDLNLVGDLNANLADGNFRYLEADKFFGDGSGLTSLPSGITYADANQHYVPYVDAIHDVNLGTHFIKANDSNLMRLGVDRFIYGNPDLNLSYNVGVAGNLYVDGVLFGDANFENVGVSGKLFVDYDDLIVDKIKGKDAKDASGAASTALGFGTTASGPGSLAGGVSFSTIQADGNGSFAFGQAQELGDLGLGGTGYAEILASNIGSTAIGTAIMSGSIFNNGSAKITASGIGSFARGYALGFVGVVDSNSYISASGNGSTAIGFVDNPSGNPSIYISASGDGSFAGGYVGQATGIITSSGKGSFSYGYNTRATNDYAVALGANSQATALESMAVNDSVASGNDAFSANESTSSGFNSASFNTSTASGYYSLATGQSCTASNSSSVCLGGSSTHPLISDWPATTVVYDLNVAHDQNIMGDLNVWNDVRVAGTIYGDGSGITGVTASPTPYNELMQEITPGADANWSWINLDGYGVSDGDAVEVVIYNTTNNAEMNGGVRKTDSALNRYFQLQEAEAGGGDFISLHVKAQGPNATIALYEETDADMVTYVIGYWH